VEKPNVLLLDEPTNHLDLEAIEALTSGLREFVGTLIFVSHDRWFVSELASRILELTPDGLQDFRGTYAEYLERLGDDHLDAEVASLAVKRVKNKAELKERSVLSQKPKALSCAELERQRDNVTRDLALAEAHMEKLDQRLCNPELFARGPSDDAKRLMEERDQLRVRIAALMQAWESAEQALEGPGNLPRD
jgi:ABC-type sulfate/molybdate transport systems ATPase subunit